MTERPGMRLLPKMTVKTRMSLWFTGVLVVICVLLLAAVAAAYGELAQRAARDELVDAVREEAALIEDDRDFRASLEAGDADDAAFARGNVQLMVYDDEGERCAGLFLHGGVDDIPLTPSNRMRRVSLDGADYYCYDDRAHVSHGHDLWVRGIVRAEAGVWDLLGRSTFLAWLVPVLVLVAFFGGRLLAGRMLRPVREIGSAARDIRASGDLSRRVAISGSGDELSQLAEDVNAMFDALERNFEAERSFTSSASHELRTPISVILAECEYAEQNASDEDELRSSIATVHRQGAKMQGIVEALLMLTRMEQGTDRYARTSCDLSALVRHVCDDFSAAVHGVRMERDIADGVHADVNRELVELALENLLRNAERYGGEGAVVRVGLVRADGRARLVVSDDGPGIPADVLEHVWELFYRADASRSTEGLGVGLALVRRVAEYHGGAAWAESAEGSGATFIMELPAGAE